MELTKSPKAKEGKKHGAAQKGKLIDFAGQQSPLFLFRKGVRRKGGFTAAERTEEKKTSIFKHQLGLVLFLLLSVF